MGKYFKRKVKKKKSKKPLIITAIIVGAVLVIALIMGIVSLIKKSMVPEYELKTDITLELNYPKPKVEDLFKVYKHMKDNMVEVDWSFLDMTKNGTYNIPVTITIDGKKDEKVIIALVDDTEEPVLKLKNHTITEGSSYKVSDFVESCSDNSNIFTVDFNGNEFAHIQAIGIHKVQIKATDDKSNTIISEATLTIKPKDEQKPVDPTPVTPTCEFGSTVKTSIFPYPLSYDMVANNNNCPIDVKDRELKDSKYNNVKKILDDMFEADKEKLEDDARFYIAKSMNASYVAVRNKEGTGIVGFSIHIYLFVDENTKTPTGNITQEEWDAYMESLKQDKYLKAEYYLKEDGTRYYVRNDYNYQ